MPLYLNIAKFPQDIAPAQSSFIVGQQEVKVGRNNDCDWCLPDPKRRVSSYHCTVRFDGTEYSIVDTSTNGVFINHSDRPVGRDRTAVLRDGDHLRLGTYEIDVAISAEVQVEDRAERDTAEIGAIADTPYSLSGLASNHVFGQLADKAEQGSDEGSDDDPFELNANHRSGTEGVLLEDRAGRLGILDDRPDREVMDWLFGSQFDQAPPQSQCLDLPEVVQRKSDQPSVSDAVQPARVGALQTFLEGAGVSDLDLSSIDEEALLQDLGSIFREMISALHELLIARAMLRNAIPVEQTQIGAAGNNPLKLSATADEAVRALIVGRGPAYLPPREAVAEAFKDIKAHQIASMAGIKTAIQAMLAEFDPVLLKGRLERTSLLDDLLPAARKAKYWALYEDLYRQISSEAQDNFRSRYWRAFARAYQDQMHRL